MYSSLVFSEVLHVWNPDGVVLKSTKGRWSGPNSDEQFYRRHQVNGKQENPKGETNVGDNIRAAESAFSSKTLFRAPVLWGISFVSIRNVNPVRGKQDLADSEAIKISLFLNITTKLSLSESWVNIILQVSERSWEVSKPTRTWHFILLFSESVDYIV